MKMKQRTRRTGIAYLIPAVLFVLLFSVIPFFWNFVLSFQKWDGFGSPAAAGFHNYLSVLQNPLSRRAIGNSILYAFSSTFGGVVLGLLFAVLILRLSQREGGIFRLILYSPAMLPTAVVGIMFVFFFNPEMGLLNSFLRLVGWAACSTSGCRRRGRPWPASSSSRSGSARAPS
jgi:raffinose/stachyose/melibiose transport system permease protein